MEKDLAESGKEQKRMAEKMAVKQQKNGRSDQLIGPKEKRFVEKGIIGPRFLFIRKKRFYTEESTPLTGISAVTFSNESNCCPQEHPRVLYIHNTL